MTIRWPKVRRQGTIRAGYGLRTVLGTGRGVGLVAAHALAAFGVLSAAAQSLALALPDPVPGGGLLVVGCVLSALGWAFFRAWPRSRVRHELRHPATVVTVEIGDLFDRDSHIVVGFSDTFDTDTGARGLIDAGSVQGQLVRRRFGGNTARLNEELAIALTAHRPAGRETRRTKPTGKLVRYPLGTVAVLGPPGRRVFAVAYSRMGNDRVARSSVQCLWSSLDRLWDAVEQAGRREPLAVPVMGGGLSRVDALDRESLIKMILLSFVARSRQSMLCRELTVVLTPHDAEQINLLEVAAFLRAL